MLRLLIFLGCLPSLLFGHHQDCDASTVCEKLAHVDEMVHLNQIQVQDMQRRMSLQEKRIEDLEKRVDSQESIIINLQEIVEALTGYIPQPDVALDKEPAIAGLDDLSVASLTLILEDVKERTKVVEEKLKNEERNRKNLENLVSHTRVAVQRVQIPEQQIQYLIATAMKNISRMSPAIGNDVYEITDQLESRLSVVEAAVEGIKTSQIRHRRPGVIADCGRDLLNDRTKWPWLVAIVGPKSHNCTGTLVDNKHIITSQNCFTFQKYSGGVDPYKNVSQWRVLIPGGYYTYHIDYIDVYEEDYDSAGTGIVIVTLTKEIWIPNFQPACLPRPQHRDLEDKQATVARVIQGTVGGLKVLIGGDFLILT